MMISDDISIETGAVCKEKGVDMFFVEEGPISDVSIRNAIARAVALCNLCPVQHKCLMIAVNNEEEFGIWGGYTSKERKKIFGKRGKIKKNITIEEAKDFVLWKRGM